MPEVLRSGNDAEIRRWRRMRALERTMEKRPDLWDRAELSPEDQTLLSALQKERSRKKLTEPVICRPMEEADLPEVMLIVRQCKNYLKKHRVNQWQDEYPTEDVFRGDMARGEAHVLTYGGRVAAFFTLTSRPEPVYDLLTDGKWSRDGAYCSLHRSAVEAEFRGTGLSDRIMAEAERLARELGAVSLRADTHRHNEPMKALLHRSGYRYRGNVLYPDEPSDPRRQAFDKVLA